MTWFADMSPYEYSTDGGEPLNIGWLDPGHEFQRGSVEERHLDMVWLLCRVTVLDTRGIHKCELCSLEDVPCTYAHRDERRLLGTGEIRVFSPSGETFAAPDLIYHYMRDHHYLPPSAFLMALETTASKDLKDYTSMVDTLGLHWKLNPLVDGEPRRRSPSEYKFQT